MTQRSLALMILLFPLVQSTPLMGQGTPRMFYPTEQAAHSLQYGEQPDDSLQNRFNETTIAATVLIRAYQEFISSQDRPACLFSVSCSNFAREAVRRTGLIRGALLSADRLLRCNHLAEDYYEIDPVTGRAIDPILDSVIYGK